MAGLADRNATTVVFRELEVGVQIHRAIRAIYLYMWYGSTGYSDKSLRSAPCFWRVKAFKYLPKV